MGYFGAGLGANGIVNGPLTIPSAANATSPGNSVYQDGPWSYSNMFEGDEGGESLWVDVEITPVSGGGGPALCGQLQRVPDFLSLT